MIAVNNRFIQDVNNFCSNLTTLFGIVFVEKPIYNGIRRVGEFYTKTGKLMTLAIDIYADSRIEVKIVDPTKGLVFSREYRASGLTRVSAVGNFIKRAINS